MLGKIVQALISGGAQAVAAAVTPFTGDKVQEESSRHGEMLARFQQYGAEFADRQNRTWWDSFIDGLNRLPRPAMALGVIAIFVWASVDPVGFAAAGAARGPRPPARGGGGGGGGAGFGPPPPPGGGGPPPRGGPKCC